MSKALVEKILNEHFKMQDSIIDLSPKILNFAQKIVRILKDNGTVFWCGNGGSASDSQHLAAELVGRFEQNRPPLKSISLNTDTSIITALSNDFSYDMIFERQLDALATSKDLLIVISTSGNSKNIIKVLKKAKEKKIFINNRLSEIKENLEIAENNMLEFLNNNKNLSSPNLLLKRDRMNRDVNLYNQLYISLSDQLEIAKIDEKDTTSSLFLLDKAYTSHYKQGTSLIAGIIQVFLFIYFIYFFNGLYKFRKELFQ